MNWLAHNKDAFDALSKIATIIAVVAGGGWAIYHYWNHREQYPRAKLRHEIVHWISPGVDAIFVRVSLHVENTSKVLLSCGETFCRLQQVSPPDIDDLNTPGFSDELKLHNSTEFPWRLIEERKFDSAKTPREIEPAETDEIHFDFKISSTVTRFIAYSYIGNKSKASERRIGWCVTTLYDLKQQKDKCPKATDSPESTAQAEPASATKSIDEQPAVRISQAGEAHNPNDQKT